MHIIHLEKLLKNKQKWLKKIKAIEDHGKQLAESNELIKKDFNIDREYTTWWTKNVFNRLVEEKSYEFLNLKEKINPNNLIYYYKNEGRRSKDFSGYQNSIDLLINLRDGYVNPREILKNIIELK